MYPPPRPPSSGTGTQDAWQRLSRGRTLGKQINIPLQPADIVLRGSSLNLFQLQGQDDDALQLSLNLLPLLIIPADQFPGGIPPTDGTVQDASGGRYNDNMYLFPPPLTSYSYGTGAVAIIEWGIGGVQSIAECDFTNGLCVNICASWVRIQAFLDQALADVDNVISGGVWCLRSYIGPGYPRNPSAQRTYSVGSIGSLDPNFPFPSLNFKGTATPPIPVNNVGDIGRNAFPVPFYAKQAWVVGTSAVMPQVADFDALIIFFRDALASKPMATFRITNDNPGPVPVPNGAFYWTIQANIPAAPAFFWPDISVVFDLAI